MGESPSVSRGGSFLKVGCNVKSETPAMNSFCWSAVDLQHCISFKCTVKFSKIIWKNAYIFLMVYSFQLWPLTHIQRTKMLLINPWYSGALQTLVTILSFVLFLPWTELRGSLWQTPSLILQQNFAQTIVIGKKE